MKPIKLITVCIVVVSLLIGAAVYLLPLPTYAAAYPDFYERLSTISFLAILSVGAALLLFMGLSGFKTSFRRVYYLICLGLLVQTVGTFPYLIEMYLGPEYSEASLLIGEILLTSGIVLMFLGIVRFARLLQISSQLTNLVVVGAASFIAVAILWVLPHPPIAGSELQFDLRHALALLQLIFYLASAALTFQTRAAASSQYSASLLYLGLAFAMSALSVCLVLINDYAPLPSWMSITVISIPYFLSSFLYLAAGYTFNRITRGPQAAVTSSNSLIGSVSLLARLASKPQEIDSMLDTLRVITAEHGENPTLSPTEQKHLRTLYLNLETYLLERETLRRFTKQELRDLVRERFNWAP